MSKPVFEFQDYKTYLQERLKDFPKRGHGMQARMAHAIGCQSTYVSRVFQGESDFSLEQGEAIGRFLGMSQEETHFFLLLLQKARAGSTQLAQYFESQITEILKRRLILKDRLKITDQISDQDKVRYYSQWYYPATHIALTIPEFQTREELAEHFNLPAQVVATVLEFLLRCGLAVQEGHRYKPGQTRIHLGTDSPLIAKSHINWRLQAIRSLESENEDDLHYSSVVSLSRSDRERIKADLIRKIEETKAVIKDSKEEELCCFSVDFFGV